MNIPPTPFFSYPENNWVLCDYATSNPNTYNLSVLVISHQKYFWLDYVEYTPLVSSGQEKAGYVKVDNNDLSISYGPGWTVVGGNRDNLPWAHLTTTKGDNVTFSFVGASLPKLSSSINA